MAALASPSPRTLDQLPEDVLREILWPVLTDTTDRTRASVLRVCSALLDAAGGLLYENVHVKSYASWKQLFCSGLRSPLAAWNGRGLANHVKQLRLSFDPRVEDPLDRNITCEFPNCVHLILDAAFLYGLAHPLDKDVHYLSSVLSSLKDLKDITFTSLGRCRPFTRIDFLDPVEKILGLRHPVALRTIHFEAIFVQYVDPNAIWVSCMSGWRTERVVYSARGGPWRVRSVSDLGRRLEGWLFGNLVEGSFGRSGEDAYGGWGRVEMRVGPEVERACRAVVQDKMAGIVAPEDKRLVSLIVFVDEDGSERKLVEESDA